ncbi:MAG: arylsulfatase [Lentisphaeria bacterium]|nr:arylsulfatase [Lentisphaeria bacterium]
MANKPNLLLIMTDHWRGDCLGRLGHPVAETPHLDSLSRRGVTFTRAYTPCASCIGARRSLMTGQIPDRHGMLGYQDGKPWDYPVNMAGQLAKGGYQTINIGKTHFHPKRLHLGFEQLITPEDYQEWLATQTDAGVEKFAHGVPGNSWMARPNHLPENLMEETWFVTQSLEFLRKRDPTRPFFMTLSFNGPHPPWCPPQVYYDQFIDRPMPEPVTAEWSRHHAEEAGYPLDVNSWRGAIPPHLNQRARAAYFGYLAYLDAQIGRLMMKMLRGGLLNNTCVVFSADHGEMLGDHNLWRKTYAYEPSARIPFIVAPPNSIDCQRNTEIEAPVGLEDVMPTFLETAELPVPKSVDGLSVLPLLRGENAPWRDVYHGEHSPCYDAANANHFITDGRWKFIWNPITGEEQLFDLSNDPEERSELSSSDQHAETLAQLRTRMVQELDGRPEGFSDGTTLSTAPYPVWRGGGGDDLHLG